jgi:hypothetical protein
MFAALGISSFPHGEPYRSHHCQNMKTGFITLASIFQTFEEQTFTTKKGRKQTVFERDFCMEAGKYFTLAYNFKFEVIPKMVYDDPLCGIVHLKTNH